MLPSLPAYLRIQNELLERIVSGQLTPGDALPSERELARLYKVSPMTARSALSGLERQGTVERRRGAGTFVALTKINYNKLVSTTELMAGRGLTARSRILGSKIVKDPEVCARLGLPDTSPLLRLERLRLAGKNPLALEVSFLPADRFGALATTPLENGSLFATLESNYNLEIAYADEEVDATAADKKVAARLQISDGDPLLRIRQVIHSTNGDPILYVIGLYRSDRHKLQVRRVRR